MKTGLLWLLWANVPDAYVPNRGSGKTKERKVGGNKMPRKARLDSPVHCIMGLFGELNADLLWMMIKIVRILFHVWAGLPPRPKPAFSLDPHDQSCPYPDQKRIIWFAQFYAQTSDRICHYLQFIKEECRRQKIPTGP